MDWCWDIIERYRNGISNPNNISSIKMMESLFNMMNQNNKTLISTIQMVQSSILTMQEQSTKTNEIILKVLENTQPKDKFQSNGMPAWTSKVFPKIKQLKEYYYPNESKYKNTYQLIFKEFNDRYGSDLLSVTVDDFCYKNNCKTCSTMDAIAYTPEIRDKMELTINDMIKNITENSESM